MPLLPCRGPPSWPSHPGCEAPTGDRTTPSAPPGGSVFLKRQRAEHPTALRGATLPTPNVTAQGPRSPFRNNFSETLLKGQHHGGAPLRPWSLGGSVPQVAGQPLPSHTVATGDTGVTHPPATGGGRGGTRPDPSVGTNGSSRSSSTASWDPSPQLRADPANHFGKRSNTGPDVYQVTTCIPTAKNSCRFDPWPCSVG